MYSLVIHSFSLWGNILPDMDLGRVFSVRTTGIFFLSSLLWRTICFRELFGIFLVIGYLHMNIKYRQSLWFLPQSVVSDILAFSGKNLIFVLGLSYL